MSTTSGFGSTTTAVSCRFCAGDAGSVVLDLGRQPSSELFPLLDDTRPDVVHPLRLWLCDHCGLAQLADRADADEEPVGQEPAALREQRTDAVCRLAEAGILPAAGTVAEFPSPHGGTWLHLLAEHGLVPAGPDERAEVVVDGCFGIMHAADQRTALQARARRLADDGVLLLQFHSLAAIVGDLQWNAVRLGHYAYYSTPALVGMLADLGLTVTAAWSFDLYGGTVLLAAVPARRAQVAAPAAAPDALVAGELAHGVLDPARVASLQSSVTRTAEGLQAMLREHRDRGQRVYGYAAASRAVSLLNLAGVDTDLLAGVADASPAKHGRRMPGTTIPIITPAELVAAAPDVVLVFVSELLDEARAALPQVEAAGGRWIDVGRGR